MYRMILVHRGSAYWLVVIVHGCLKFCISTCVSATTLYAAYVPKRWSTTSFQENYILFVFFKIIYFGNTDASPKRRSRTWPKSVSRTTWWHFYSFQANSTPFHKSRERWALRLSHWGQLCSSSFMPGASSGTWCFYLQLYPNSSISSQSSRTFGNPVQ